MKVHRSIVLLLAAAVGSCATVEEGTGIAMSDSLSKYKACLNDHSANPSVCDGLRMAYEADLEAFRAHQGK